MFMPMPRTARRAHADARGLAPGRRPWRRRQRRQSTSRARTARSSRRGRSRGFFAVTQRRDHAVEVITGLDDRHPGGDGLRRPNGRSLSVSQEGRRSDGGQGRGSWRRSRPGTPRTCSSRFAWRLPRAARPRARRRRLRASAAGVVAIPPGPVDPLDRGDGRSRGADLRRTSRCTSTRVSAPQEAAASCETAPASRRATTWRP